MSRESAQVKARRLLVEGRLRVISANEDEACVAAEVRGDSARTYVVSYDTDGGWCCSCPTIGVCSHIRAVQLIVVVEPSATASEREILRRMVGRAA